MTETEADPDVRAALPGDVRPSRQLSDAWLRGLGCNRAAPAEVLTGLFDARERPLVHSLYRDDLPAGVRDSAVVHPSRTVRGTAAESGRLSPAQWSRLLAATPRSAFRDALAEPAAEQRARWAAHPETGVRTGIEPAPDSASRPPAGPAAIAAMAATVPDAAPEDRTHAVWWIAALHGDADAMRGLARSRNLRIRRSAARAPHLPPDVVELLAHDEDRVVRLFLTESCDDAPGDLLLEVWSRWYGSFSFPGRPRNHPDFPRHDLIRFADDPRPRMRLLALDDPASSAPLIERFSADPDGEVRSRAADDPRLSPESAARLTTDADHRARRSARQNPALPPEVLIPLLLDEHSAEDAARNPSLPTSVMHRMISLAAARG
ncbi:hypothetical protein ACFVFH_14940 [Streptomyces sp. NPDC057697]|uniref:hypothetical protein n=1 Tax=Streptomyces sp. NPDC057697 TaxID=3346219 RepID=UPI0036ABA846